MKGVATWDGEALGTSDVMFTRLSILERDYVESRTDVGQVWLCRRDSTCYYEMNIHNCVMALVYESFKTGKTLQNIMEEILVMKKEEYENA